jgi:hypothetical protein
MAYLRGDHYVFDSGEHLCWWANGRHHAPAESGSGETWGVEGEVCVEIPWRFADRFVLMRLAELLVNKEVDTVLDPMIEEEGNTGMIQLLGNLDVIRSALRDLQGRVRRATVDEVFGDGT